MTRNATAAATGAPPAPRRTVVRGLVVATVVLGLAWFAATPALAGLGDPVDPRDTTEPEQPTTTTEPSDEPSTTDAEGPTTTSAGEEVEPEDASVETDDDGTSIAALAAVGVVAFVLGLIVAAIPLGAALSRRKATPRVPGPPPAPAGPPPGPGAPSAAGPTIGPAPSRDADQLRHQRVVLVEALIALRDQLPSAALGQEALRALEGAGITEVAPVGQPFDAGQHHAVHQEATDDPARRGTIVSVERPGYRDGTTVIRQPEVVVAVDGGSS